jgi:hypothetical protein
MSGGLRRWPLSASVLLAALTLAGLVSPAAAQSPAPLAYRRIYVPEDEVTTQIRGLLPMKREEFEQRLQAALQKSHLVSGPPAARIDAATFRARFDGTALVGGRAELTIVATTDEPTLLPLEPCNLALEGASWRRDGEQAAVIGVDPGGKLQCLVEGSGVLVLDWSCPAAAASGGETLIVLRLPPAGSRRLEITAPSALDLAASSGLTGAGKSTGGALGAGSERLWTVDLDGAAEVTLRVRPREANASTQPLLTVRESTICSVFRSQVDVNSTFSIDVLERAAEEIQLHCDPSLQVTEVRLGDKNVPFSIDERPARGPAKIHVSLPAPLTGLNQTLHVAGTADWPAAGAWNLPRIRVADASYQEGQAEITAPPWLRLDVRPVRGCATMLVTPAAAGRTQEKFTLQLFAADSAIAIRAEPMPAPLREESGLQVIVESNQVNGVLVAELTSLAGSQFEAQARLPRQWIVDAVETQPPEMLADRFLDARGTGPQILRLRLNRPITASRPLRLVIRAHYRRPANGQPLGESLFRLATFPDARDCRRLVAVRVADPAAELRLGGRDHLERLDPAQLSPADARLFESPPGGMLFLPTAGGERFAAVLQPTTARYRADVAVRAEIDEGALRSSVNLHCEPEGPAVTTAAVRLSPRPGGPVTWRLRGEEDRELAATIEASPSASGATEEIVYRLLLPRPQTAAFDIVGQWIDAAAGSSAARTDLPLAWAPEAVAQTGVIEIFSPDANLLLETSEAEPLPRLAASDRASAELRARYRYTLGRQPRVAVRSLREHREKHGAWIERLDLVSRLGADGFGEHEATFAVGNAGTTTLRVRLPPGAADIEPVDHEAAIDADLSGREETLVTFRLPPAERQCVVKLRYTSQYPPPGWWPVATLAAPVPQPEAAVLDRSWTVSLPPELAADMGRSKAVLRDHHDAAQEGSFIGWSTVHVELPPQDEAAVRVYRPLVVRIWALCTGIVALAVSWRRSRLARWLWPLTALVASVAVIALGPAAWLLVAAAIGSFAGNLVGLLRGAIAARAQSPGSLPDRTAVLMGGGPAAGSLLALAALAHSLFAAPQDVAAPAGTRTYRVVVPVNDQHEPTGDYVYLEAELYDALHRATQGASRAATPWLLERARYDLTSVAPGVAGRSAVGELLLALDFHTFAAAGTVSLPLSRSEVLLLESRARLDGRPVSLTWRGDGAALLAPVESAGKHRLELALGTLPKATGRTATLDIAAPDAAIRSITGTSALSIDLAAVEKPAIAGTRELALACSPRLVVQLPSPQDAALAAATLEADQLLWWKVRPGSVTVQGRFRLRPLPGPVQEAVIEFDPRLRLLPGLASGAIDRLAVEEGNPNRVRVSFDGSAGEPTFQLAWLWPEASGSGTLVLPRITALADRLLRNWVGVSVEPRLTLEDLPPATHTTPLDFARAWGEGALAPAAIFEPHGGLAVQLSIRPGSTTPTIEQTTQWSVDSTGAHAAFSAELKDVPPGRWAHRFKMPPQLRVRGVTLLQADRRAAHRWSQAPDGTLVVTLLEPPTAEQSLQIAADLPIRGMAELALPRIEAGDTLPGPASLEIYRQQDVLVSAPSAPHWTAAANARLGEYKSGLGRLVAALQSTSDAAGGPVSIEISPNKPRLSGQMLIRAAQADGDWRGEAHLHLNVADGVLDELRLSIPERWPGPLAVMPPMPQRQETFAGESRRQLLLRPAQPVQGHLDLTLRGPLHSAGGGVQAPDLVVLGDWQIERLVRLDRDVAGERIDWQVTGLVLAPADVAAKLPPAWRSASGDLYRVTAPRFDATARSEQLAAAAPRVGLADLRLSVRPGRRVVGRAIFTLLPGQLRELRLSLPPGSRLVQTLIDDRAVVAAPAGLRTWTIPAPSPRLPCQLTVLYDTALPPGGSSGEIAGPELADLAVEHSLWSLEADSLRASLGPADIVHDSARREPPATSAAIEDAELLRLEAAVEALESVLAAQASDLPIGDLRESFRRREAEYERCEQITTARLELFSAADHHVNRLEAATQRASRVRQRLSLGDMAAIEPAAATRDASPAEPWPGTTLAAPGMLNRVNIKIDSASSADAWPRRGWSFAMLSLAAVGLAALRQRRGASPANEAAE